MLGIMLTRKKKIAGENLQNPQFSLLTSASETWESFNRNAMIQSFVCKYVKEAASFFLCTQKQKVTQKNYHSNFMHIIIA